MRTGDSRKCPRPYNGHGMHTHRETPRRRARLSGSLILAALAFAPAGPSTAAGQPRDGNPVDVRAVTLRDHAFGFDIDLPAAWLVDQAPFAGPSGASGVVRARSADARRTMQILVFRASRPQRFPDWLAFFTRQLRAGPGVLDARSWADGRALRLSAYVLVEAALPTETGRERLSSWYYCMELDAGLIWVLSQAVLGNETPPADSEPASPPAPPAELSAALRSLHIRYDPLLAAELRAATVRGREFLASGHLQRAARELRIDTQERFYLLELDRNPSGFVARQFSRDLEPLARPGDRARPKEGLRVREKRWQFGPDGSARYETLDLFASLDGATDLAERVVIDLPAEPGAPLGRTHQQCIREGDVLIASTVPSTPRAERPPSHPIALPGSYHAQAWARLLPALLLDQTDPLPGFEVFDSTSGGLIPALLAPLGEQALPGTTGQRARAFELRQGFAPPGLLFTDSYGNLLRQQLSGETLQLSDAATIEQRFGRQRDAVMQRISPGP